MQVQEAQAIHTPQREKWTTVKNRNPQVAPAMALVQLLTEHPELPAVSWRIDLSEGVLSGWLSDDSATFEALRSYAETLGGSIRVSHDYVFEGVQMRSHHLNADWRDVRIQLALALPVAVPVAVAL